MGSALPLAWQGGTSGSTRTRSPTWANDISGGKILHSRTLKSDNRAGQAFLQAAASVTRSNSTFGAFYRRKRAQIGPQQALVATTHKNLS
jgi:hypothetical protein